MALWASPHQTVTLTCKVDKMLSEVECHWMHAPKTHIYQNVTAIKRFNLQMDRKTGICTLEFKPDHSDLGQWVCSFIVPGENSKEEVGSASIVLLNGLGDERLGWIVGALTAITLFLMIIIVVLVVCKTRLFVRKSSRILETLPASSKQQNSRANNERYSENPVKDLQVPEGDQNQNATNIDCVLPNRSPHFYERVERHRKSSKVYENIKM